MTLVAVLAANGRYHDSPGPWAELRQATTTAFAGCAALGLIGALTGAPTTVSLLALLAFPLLAAATTQLAKSVLIRAGLWAVPVLILDDASGAAESGTVAIAQRLRAYRISGRVTPDAVIGSNEPRPLKELLRRHGAERLLIAADGHERQRLMVAQALRERVDFSVLLPASVVPRFAAETVQPFGYDGTLLLPRRGRQLRAARAVKVGLDVAVAALLLILVSPLLLTFAILVRRDGGPALYAHRRLGAGGRSFACLKFRTMVINGDAVLEDALNRSPALAAEWAMTRKLRDDPRVTPIGRFLRRTSLDELPQLINVLRMDMSLVGPRPIVASEVPFYGADITHYYAGRPGLTGLWQVSGRSNTSYQRRVQMDVWYVNNWTLWIDFLILLMTIPAVITGDGAA
ncbi:MAG: sugar transferase [Proteobacteria bacterium]|nr:sugar transferase [Pseudomonadota bacterium]